MTDPFADDYTPAITKTEESPVAEYPSVAETPGFTQPADADFVTAILKGGAGYGAPSLSIRANNIPSLHATLTDHEDEIKDVLTTLAKLGKGFGILVDGEKPAGGGGNSGGGGGGGNNRAPAQASEHPDGKTEYCEHGKMQFKSGMGKNGKPWKAFDCPNRVCDRKWDR